MKIKPLKLIISLYLVLTGCGNDNSGCECPSIETDLESYGSVDESLFSSGIDPKKQPSGLNFNHLNESTSTYVSASVYLPASVGAGNSLSFKVDPMLEGEQNFEISNVGLNLLRAQLKVFQSSAPIQNLFLESREGVFNVKGWSPTEEILLLTEYNENGVVFRVLDFSGAEPSERSFEGEFEWFPTGEVLKETDFRYSDDATNSRLIIFNSKLENPQLLDYRVRQISLDQTNFTGRSEVSIKYSDTEIYTVEIDDPYVSSNLCPSKSGRALRVTATDWVFDLNSKQWVNQPTSSPYDYECFQALQGSASASGAYTYENDSGALQMSGTFKASISKSELEVKLFELGDCGSHSFLIGEIEGEYELDMSSAGGERVYMKGKLHWNRSDAWCGSKYCGG